MSRRTPSRVWYGVCRIRSDQLALSGRRARTILAGVINAMARRSANFIARSPVKRRFCLLVALVIARRLPDVGNSPGYAGKYPS